MDNYLDPTEKEITKVEMSYEPAKINVVMPTAELKKINTKLDTLEVKLERTPKTIEKDPNEVTKVEVQNPQPFPETMDVVVKNQVQPESFPIDQLVAAIKSLYAVVQKVEVTNLTPAPVIPDKVSVDNLPLGKGDTPGVSDPERFLNVRLTNGKRFYNAVDYAMASAGGGGGGKVSPASIGELLNLSLNITTYTEIVFSGNVIAFEVQNRSATDMYLSNDANGRTYWTIKAGTSKALTMTITRGWYLLAKTGTPIAEILGIR